MKFSKPKHKVLHLGWGNPQYQYRPGNECMENSPVQKDLGILVDKKIGHLTMCACSPESQSYPGLDKKKGGQQVEGGDSAPLLS